MRKTFAFIGLLGGLATMLPAHAQFAKPEDAIKYRKAGFTVMAAHFGRLGPEGHPNSPSDGHLRLPHLS